jgi:hypothetical protein
MFNEIGIPNEIRMFNAGINLETPVITTADAIQNIRSSLINEKKKQGADHDAINFLLKRL